jgi:hypothetical protein
MHKTCTSIIVLFIKTILGFIFTREGKEIKFVLGMGVSTAGPSQAQDRFLLNVRNQLS